MASVLDDLDDETARLVLLFQLQDLDELEAARVDPNAAADHASNQYARRMQEAELESYCAVRGFGLEPDAIEGEQQTVEAGEHGSVAHRVRVVRVDCIIRFGCDGSIPRSEAYRAPCGHYFCADCLNTLFERSMTDPLSYPPRCCQNQHIPLQQALSWLPEDTASAFEDKREELEDQHQKYCHVPTCSAYIPAPNREGNSATCPSCSERTCLLCSNAIHPGACPTDEGVESVLTMAGENGWQRCGTRQDEGCGHMVEISTGCYHMTCRCGRQFCLVCGDRWKTCQCPQWDERRLYNQAQDVAEREGQEGEETVQQVAEELRQNQECAVHNFTRVYANGRRLECGMCDFSTSWRGWICKSARLVCGLA